MIRLGICNELFEGWDLAEVCRTVKGLGYDGIELAPFTLAPRITDLSAERRREIRRTIADSGLWVLPNPSGLNAHYQLRDLARLFEELRRAVEAKG